MKQKKLYLEHAEKHQLTSNGTMTLILMQWKTNSELILVDPMERTKEAKSKSAITISSKRNGQTWGMVDQIVTLSLAKDKRRGISLCLAAVAAEHSRNAINSKGAHAANKT